MVLTAMLSFSGCSDTVEDLAQSNITLMEKCFGGVWDKEKCKSEKILLKERQEDLKISNSDLKKIIRKINKKNKK